MWSFFSDSDMWIWLTFFGLIINILWSLHIRAKVIRDMKKFPKVYFASSEAEALIKATIHLPTLMVGNFIISVAVLAIAAYVPFMGACGAWAAVILSKPFEVKPLN